MQGLGGLKGKPEELSVVYAGVHTWRGTCKEWPVEHGGVMPS